MTSGINDETFTRFLELCDSLHISPLAASAIGDFLNEAYYQGYDTAHREITLKNDLKQGIAKWKEELKKGPSK
jgi:hypothetical protein